MGRLRLEDTEIAEFAELLDAVFLPPRFDEFLSYRLNRRTYHFASQNDDYPTVLRKVIQEANAKLWWRNLLREARNAVPDDPGLLAFGERFGLSPQVVAPAEGGTTRLSGAQLELKIKAAHFSYDILTWRRLLGEVEGRVCRVEYPPTKAQGTGFLIGPNAVLTNYHVIEPVLKGTVTPGEVALRFDYKVLEDGVAVSPGTVYRLAAGEWLYDSSPYSPRDEEVAPASDPKPDELDYAILTVEGAPGNDPVGGKTGDPRPATRGWVQVPGGTHDFMAQRALYIVQHPDGKPMQVALDTEAVIGLNGNQTRVRYATTTEPGSSGSPCFGPDWGCVALHHSGDPKYLRGQKPEFNQGIPLAAIRRLLRERGKEQVLGA